MQEEANMDDILASIRRILTSEQQKRKEQEPESAIVRKTTVRVSVEPSSDSQMVSSEPGKVPEIAIESDEPFILTSDMRVDMPVEKEPKNDLVMTADTLENQMRPLIQKWLDENLPDVVEKVVREEVGRVLARVLK